jgi:hypothetical protein
MQEAQLTEVPAGKVQLPTLESLTAQITQMILQRSQAKDQIEQIEKVMPILQGQLQLLQAQAQAAKEAVAKD